MEELNLFSKGEGAPGNTASLDGTAASQADALPSLAKHDNNEGAGAFCQIRTSSLPRAVMALSWSDRLRKLAP